MPRRRLRVGAVGPELGDHPRPVAALHQVGGVRLAGDRIHGVAGAVVGAQAVVAERKRRDVDHHAVVGIQRGGVAQHLGEAVLVLAAAGAAEIGRRARVVEHAVARHGLAARQRQGERRHHAPVRADEALHPPRLHPARLVHEQAQRQRLPAVGVEQLAGAGVGHHHRRVGRPVVELERVGAELVGAVVVAVVQDQLGDAVADRGRVVALAVGHPVVVAELDQQVVEARQRFVGAGRDLVAAVQHAVGGVADRLVARGVDVVGVVALLEEDRLGHVVVHRPGVPHRRRHVVQVARVQRRAGEVVANRLQHHLAPQPRHRVRLLRHGRNRHRAEEGAGDQPPQPRRPKALSTVTRCCRSAHRKCQGCQRFRCVVNIDADHGRPDLLT